MNTPKVVQRSRGGISYLAAVLRERKTVVTRSVFWRIPHKSGREEIHLRLGRYQKSGFNSETLEATSPKSELTLDSEELTNLLAFLNENYEPMRTGARAFIALEGPLDGEIADQLHTLFRSGKRDLLEFILKHDILPEEVFHGVEQHKKFLAVKDFEKKLESTATESVWQKWFSENSWVLGSEFVRILDERAIDTGNIADYLMQAYDGFLDIIEIKRPHPDIKFWSSNRDHNNIVPSSDLIKAVTQAHAYVYEVEREVNSVKFAKRMDGVEAVKPRCVLVFGRSNNWDDDEKRAYRILNSSYHNLTIMTYDHVLARAERMLGRSPMIPGNGAEF